MDYEMLELLKYRYQRAVETLEVAKELFVKGKFNKEFVATEIFPHTIGRKISMLALIREQSDYNDFYIASSAESQQQVEITEELIQLIAEYFKNKEIEL